MVPPVERAPHLAREEPRACERVGAGEAPAEASGSALKMTQRLTLRSMKETPRRYVAKLMHLVDCPPAVRPQVQHQHHESAAVPLELKYQQNGEAKEEAPGQDSRTRTQR